MTSTLLSRPPFWSVMDFIVLHLVPRRRCMGSVPQHIAENLEKISENLGKITENPGKNGAQRCLTSQNGA